MSGNAVPGCGAIHIDEIKPTLDRLSLELNLPDLNTRVLGSVGKKDYSGDLDVVLDAKTSPEIKQFGNDLIAKYGKANVNHTGALIHIKYPIEKFDSSKIDRLPRTGFVQVDFNFGDEALLKLFNHSPGRESKFKGLHRNIALASIAGIFDSTISDDKDDRDRPAEQIRWKWSPRGLVHIKRISKKNSITGAWNKAQFDIDLGEIITDPKEIAKCLFNGVPEDMNSLESIVAAVKKQYSIDFQSKIFGRMAKNFVEKGVVNGYDYPPEIAEYFSVDDK